MNVISTLQELALRLRTDSRAQDMVEYSLAAGFIAVAVPAVFPPSIAPAISTSFRSVVDVLPDIQ
ncbi:MAG: Flp family type IVb pilin [bacterium]|nr:Flp family type IVb pilin [bacterium]